MRMFETKPSKHKGFVIIYMYSDGKIYSGECLQGYEGLMMGELLKESLLPTK